MEFLGDAIIEAVVSDVLYARFPQANEGFLSLVRSNMVCRTRLNEISFALGLPEYIKLASRQDIYVSHIPGDVLEAFVAAIFLDGGMAKADAFVRKYIASEQRIQEACNDETQSNFKSDLLSQGEQAGVEVFFETHRLDGDSDVYVFKSSLFVNNQEVAVAEGHNKKKAEQEAARIALEKIKEGSLDLAAMALAKAQAKALESQQSLAVDSLPADACQQPAPPSADCTAEPSAEPSAEAQMPKKPKTYIL